MGEALIRGLLKAYVVLPENAYATGPRTARRTTLINAVVVATERSREFGARVGKKV
jgi:hypothetical protein